MTVVKVYRPQDWQIQIHLTRVTLCPLHLRAGFYWYGDKCHRPGRPPKWVDRLLQGPLSEKAGEDHPPQCRISSMEVNPTRGESEAGATRSELQWTTPRPLDTSRRGLMRQVRPPDRLQYTSSGRACSYGGPDVAYLVMQP